MADLPSLSPHVQKKVQIALLIDSGVKTAPDLSAKTGIPLRTVAYHLSNMQELGIEVEHIGGRKGGEYRVNNWGIIDSVAARHLLTEQIQVGIR